MSAINSGIGTKGFSYSFNADGLIDNTKLIYTGITLKAGESPIDLRCCVLIPLVTSLPGLEFLVNAQIGDGSVYGATLFTQTVVLLNGAGSSLATGDATSNKFAQNASVRYPFNSNIDLPIYFTTGAGGQITGGRISFIMTYLYTKF